MPRSGRSAATKQRSERRARRPVIESKRAEEALRRSEAGLRLALDAGQMGTWEWDIGTGEINWSRNLEPMHGLAPGTFQRTFDGFQALIHPDDRQRVLEVIRRSVESRADYETEFRNLWPDGSVHWILGKGRVLTDEQGQPARMIGVCTDITKRKQAEETMREADRRKDEFLAMISHELRNPLSAILNAVSLLDHAEMANPLFSKARTVVRRQTEQLTRIVDDLLDIARLTAGKLILVRAPLDLAALVGKCVKELAGRRALEHHRHELRLKPTFIVGDAARLEQILMNLITNAVKYTLPGGTITVKVRPEGQEAVLRVRDTGIGIAPELLGRVFDLFVQSDRGLDRSDGGLGVGLSVVRRLVEAHGGRVEAKSPGPNRGSELVVRLPLVAAPARRARRITAGADPSVSRRILVVDDNIDTREGLVALLQIAGHEVHEADAGPTGLDAASRLELDAAVIDIGLPGYDGFELARRLRARGSTLHLIALTGYGDPEHRRLGTKAGFDAYLVKPVVIDGLLHELAAAPRARDAGKVRGRRPLTDPSSIARSCSSVPRTDR